MEVSVKKDGWTGGGSRTVQVVNGVGDEHVLKVSAKTLTISVGAGLPNTISNHHTAFAWWHKTLFFCIFFWILKPIEACPCLLAFIRFLLMFLKCFIKYSLKIENPHQLWSFFQNYSGLILFFFSYRVFFMFGVEPGTKVALDNETLQQAMKVVQLVRGNNNNNLRSNHNRTVNQQVSVI